MKARNGPIALHTGLLPLETLSSRIDPAEIRREIEASRDRLQGEVTKARVAYQASLNHPDCIEQIHPDGHVLVGRFENGAFVPSKTR